MVTSQIYRMPSYLRPIVVLKWVYGAVLEYATPDLNSIKVK